MASSENSARLRHLARAFRAIASSTPDMKVDGPARRAVRSAPARPRPVFRVRLRSATGGARARMYVHSGGALLEARSGASPEGEERKAASDRLGIDLGRDYSLDSTTFHDAGEMAAVLLKRMERQLEAVSEPGASA